jgi:hypothetical protein
MSYPIGLNWNLRFDHLEFEIWDLMIWNLRFGI